MLTALLPRWFSRQPRHEAPSGCPQAVAPTLPAARAPRPTAIGPPVWVAAGQTVDGRVIRVIRVIRVKAARRS